MEDDIIHLEKEKPQDILPNMYIWHGQVYQKTYLTIMGMWQSPYISWQLTIHWAQEHQGQSHYSQHATIKGSITFW